MLTKIVRTDMFELSKVPVGYVGENPFNMLTKIVPSDMFELSKVPVGYVGYVARVQVFDMMLI